MEQQNNSEKKVEISSPKKAETNKYIPGSSEKKRAILMYLFLWIVLVSAGKNPINRFEYAHFKQALGWWVLFFWVLMTNIVLLFLPILKWLSILLIIAILGVSGFFVKQAWDWKYYVLKQESPLFVFQWLGAWILNLFDLELNVEKDEQEIFLDEGLNEEDLDLESEKNLKKSKKALKT